MYQSPIEGCLRAIFCYLYLSSNYQGCEVNHGLSLLQIRDIFNRKKVLRIDNFRVKFVNFLLKKVLLVKIVTLRRFSVNTIKSCTLDSVL